MPPEFNVIKLFNGHKLRLFIISQSVCLWQAFSAQSNVRLTLEWSTCNVLHSGMLRPYPQTLDQAGKACEGQRSSLLQKVVTYVRKIFCNTATWRNPFQRQRFYEIWTFCHQSYKTFFCCKLQNNFILFLNYTQAQYAGVSDYTSPERFCRDKHSTLVGPFVSCEEKEVLSRK